MLKFDRIVRAALVASAATLMTAASSAWADSEGRYVQHNLVSDGTIPADHADPNLLNAWGVVFNPTGFVWVADNHSGKSTLYDGMGNPQSLVVSIPAAAGNTTGSPTGIVFSGTSDFPVTNGMAPPGPALVAETSPN